MTYGPRRTAPTSAWSTIDYSWDKLREEFLKWKQQISRNPEEYAQDLSQAVLVSHLDMIVAVLNFLGIPHEEGFFAKDLDAKAHLTEGWQERVHEKFKDVYPESLLRFYTAHLAWELLHT
jgi:hypothetical protein